MDTRSVIDLPEPRKPVLSEEQKAERERRLWTTLMAFAVSYSLLHKLVVPLALKLTVLASSPYSRVDSWWVHSATLVFCLLNLPRTQRVLSLLAGAGVVYGGVEVAEAYLGHFPGWLAVSRLLSSVPIAGLCIAILTQGRFPIRPVYAWTGATIAAAMLYVAIGVLR